MKIFRILVLLTLSLGLSAQEIAITFDDLPVALYGRHHKEEQKKIFYTTLKVLDRYGVKVTGFVVGKNIETKQHWGFLKEFLRRGHSVGNHSYSHYDLNLMKADAYMKDILRCQKIIDPLVKGIRYFRYPMLHRGNSLKKRDRLYFLLNQNNFIVAPVSIDNDEYRFNIPTIEASRRGDSLRITELKNEYLEHMKGRVLYFRNLSRDRLKRDMKHILLLHLNFVNSLFLEDLFRYLKAEGWSFITLEEALKDPVYTNKDIYCGTRGLGWLERLSPMN